MTFLANFVIFATYMARYDIIVTANARTAQLIALYRKILNKRIPRQIVLELMLEEENDTAKWRIKRSFQRFLFQSIDTVFVSSEDEINTYAKRVNLAKERFRFLPFHTNIVKPEMISNPGSYILSAGRTGRDYATLTESVKDLPLNMVIVSDYESLSMVEVPNNTRIEVEIPYERYLELLRYCWFVVVPLHKLIKSSGQVVILEAMAYGKPVIATETVGTRDYIEQDHNGILVPPYNAEALRHSIRRLMEDSTLQNTLSQNGLKAIQEKHTYEYYVTSILDVASELALARNTRMLERLMRRNT